MEVATVGIDLGKNVFHIIGLDARGKISLKRRVTRSQLAVLMEISHGSEVGILKLNHVVQFRALRRPM